MDPGSWIEANTLEKRLLDTLFVIAQLTSWIISVKLMHRFFASCVEKTFTEMDFYSDCFPYVKGGISLHLS